MLIPSYCLPDSLRTLLICLIFSSGSYLVAQTQVDIFPNAPQGSTNGRFAPGVFFVPKTQAGYDDFMQNGIHQNAIRLNVIEGALNNTTNLNDCLNFLDNQSAILQALAAKTDRLIFIFEKMPTWLSSSSDGSPAAPPGWFVLNTKPPANWSAWESMVSAVTDRIVNSYGISNASFEIWNEPDLGSWTASEASYFELFRRSYDAIKAVQSQIPVGGPVSNGWANHIYTTTPYGYVSPASADNSLLGGLIDSSWVWNRPLDFLSWHNFNFGWQTHENAVAYISQKYAGQGLSVPELIVSEWNAPSAGRDTPLHRSFMAKNTLELAKLPIANQVIAAWQDFEFSTTEFHGDYGLISYGSIYKPAYMAVLQTALLQGTILQAASSSPADIQVAQNGDTLRILVANYTPPALLEAFNHTLFAGKVNVLQLDSIGYIDLGTNNFALLDSIYRGWVTIPNSHPVQMAVNASLPIFAHYDSIETDQRQFQIQVNGILGVHNGISYLVDSTANNEQYLYDSLRSVGFSQSNAINYVVNDQGWDTEPISLNNGMVSLSMEPNAVQLLEFVIPGLVAVEPAVQGNPVRVYPNPSEGIFIIESDRDDLGFAQICDLHGKVLQEIPSLKGNSRIHLSLYPNGVYLLKISKLTQSIRLVKQ